VSAWEGWFPRSLLEFRANCGISNAGLVPHPWMLCAKLRRAMINAEREPLSGLVEADGTIIPFRAARWRRTSRCPGSIACFQTSSAEAKASTHGLRKTNFPRYLHEFVLWLRLSHKRGPPHSITQCSHDPGSGSQRTARRFDPCSHRQAIAQAQYRTS
jgi:hypothetical protein